MQLNRTDENLTALQAYDAMVGFLEAYWVRGGRTSGDIANLLSSVSRGIWADGEPGDPAQWSDWLDAISRTRAHYAARDSAGA